ncbi:MAG TPA: hypothetical protein VEY30_00590 [Myxococcaceae bacterium]|nr:hypothetical protein [Myxococcaceae bacterium]
MGVGFLRWVLLAGMAAWPGSARADCVDALASCREDCTLEFGMDVAQRNSLELCLRRCEDRKRLCRKQVREAQEARPSKKAAPANDVSVRYEEVSPPKAAKAKSAPDAGQTADPPRASPEPVLPWGAEELN